MRSGNYGERCERTRTRDKRAMDTSTYLCVHALPGRPQYPRYMTTNLRLDPALAAVVERGRERMAASGEWPRPATSFRPDLPAEAVRVITEWLDEGGYDQAVGQIAAEDPDLATE